MRLVWIPVLLAACGGNGAPAVEERLAGRRIALGLDQVGPMEVDAAMHALEKGLEGELKRAALGRLDPQKGLDVALRIESLLDRAGVASQTGDPEDFFARMRDAARLAEAWARSSLGPDPERARGDARALLDSCIECHELYRN